MNLVALVQFLPAQKNKEHSAIYEGNVKRHVLDTYSSIHGLGGLPKHILIVEADIKSSNNTTNGPKQHHIGGVSRRRILTTCGDTQV